MTIYYVDTTTGDDGDSGETEELAWETVGQVNGSSFDPGDSILFKRGETFDTDTRLEAPSSGSPGNVITFGDYGTGALPIIDGGTDTGGFFANNESYLTIQNIEFTGGTGDCVHLGGDNLILQDCAIHDPAKTACVVDGPAATRHDILIDGCTIYNVPDSSGAAYHGILIQYTSTSGYADGPVDITISNNYIYDNGGDATLDHGIYVKDCDGCIIEHNTCENNVSDNIKVNGNNANTIVRYNIMFDSPGQGLDLSGTQTAGQGNQAYYNISYSNGAAGILFGGNCDGWEIYNNTFVNNGLTVSDGQLQVTDGAESNTIKNNIFYSDEAVVGESRQAIEVESETEATANTWDYNCVVLLNSDDSATPYRVTGDDPVKQTLAEWKVTTGQADNSINSDPSFIDVGGDDFHLALGSPCIEAGVDVGLTNDYDGVPLGRGVNPDTGASETLKGGPPGL